MGNEQSSGNTNGGYLYLGQSAFCATAAVGTVVHALAPCEIKPLPKPEPVPEPPPPPPPPSNKFKKKNMWSKALGAAKIGAKLAVKGGGLAVKGAQGAVKLALGTTLRPKLVPGQEATRTCFLCFAAASVEGAGSPVLYGVDVFLRANIKDGAVLRKDGEDGQLKFKGSELEGACAVRIISATGKQTGQPVLLGEQFIMTVDDGARVFVFCGAEDGGIVLETRILAEVPAGENAVFKAAPIPAKLQQPVEEENGDSNLFVGLLGAMMGGGSLAAAGGGGGGGGGGRRQQNGNVVQDLRAMQRLASNPVGRSVIKAAVRR